MVVSLPELLQKIHQCSTPNPATELLAGVWDFKNWMNPFLTNVSGHSKYLVFRFTLGPNGIQSEMHYKKFSDQLWQPTNAGLRIISVSYVLSYDIHELRLSYSVAKCYIDYARFTNINRFLGVLVLLLLVQGCPDVVDVPAAVEPNLGKMDLDHFLQDLRKYKPWLSAVAWEAWEEFRTSTDELTVSRLNSWDLPKLVSDAILAAEARKGHVGASISNETTQILDKESAEPTKVLFLECNTECY